MILKGKKFVYDPTSGYYYTSCDASIYPSLFLLIDSYWVEIPPET